MLSLADDLLGADVRAPREAGSRNVSARPALAGYVTRSSALPPRVYAREL